MKIGIVGRGRVAQALKAALDQNHDVRFGVRDPGDATEAALADAAVWADVLILATPHQAEAVVVAAIAAHVSGKTVIDATNPVGMRDGRLDLVTDGATSAAEGLQARLAAAHVIKGFNQIGAEFVADATGLDHRPVMFAAGDDDDEPEVMVSNGGR